MGEICGGVGARVRMYVRACVCTFVRACVYMCVLVRVCVRMYVYMYVRAGVYVRTYVYVSHPSMCRFVQLNARLAN